MDFIETRLADACLIALKRIEDYRGFFARGFCRDELAAYGLNPNMTQLNIGHSHKRGTLRGLHFQIAPHEEAKLVRCSRGAVFDVIVDLRPTSETYGQWFGAELTAHNGLMLYAPEGFAHGYETLSDDTEAYYLTSAPYAPSAARGIRYDDPAFAIDWPIPVAVISEADRTWPDYQLVSRR
jgi:dTDP-4-dehydrorhamnose 3,5-epimerase